MRAAATTWMSGGLLNAMPATSVRPCMGHIAVPQLTDLPRLTVPAGCHISSVFSPLLKRRCGTSAAAQPGMQTLGRDAAVWAPAAAATATVPAAAEVGMTQLSLDEAFMDEALKEANKAAGAGEVPVGAVLVSGGGIVARAHNSTTATGNPIAHAEMLCIQQAAASRSSWRLLDATLYVTLEPCAMCAGALLQARVGTLVYGARNTLSGADGSWVNLLPPSRPARAGMQQRRPHPFHPNMQVRRGVCSERCSEVLRTFFRWRRTQPGFLEDEVPIRPSELVAVSVKS